MVAWGIGLGQTNHASALQQRLNRLAKGVEIRGLEQAWAVQAEQIDGRDRNRSRQEQQHRGWLPVLLKSDQFLVQQCDRFGRVKRPDHQLWMTVEVIGAKCNRPRGHFTGELKSQRFTKQVGSKQKDLGFRCVHRTVQTFNFRQGNDQNGQAPVPALI